MFKNEMAIDNPYSTGFEGRGLNLVIFSGAFCLWAFALILSRLYFRHKYVGRLGKDDYAILFSMVRRSRTHRQTFPLQ